jgi:hypothetical protein
MRKSGGISEPGCTAQISWIPRIFSNRSLEEIFPTNPKTLALMVRQMNGTFPYYLPNRY